MADRLQRGICRRLARNPGRPRWSVRACPRGRRTRRDLGYRPGPIDGVVGRRTKGALARYQRSEGIPVTGYLDAETLVRLDIRRRVSPAPDRRDPRRAA